MILAGKNHINLNSSQSRVPLYRFNGTICERAHFPAPVRSFRTVCSRRFCFMDHFSRRGDLFPRPRISFGTSSSAKRPPLSLQTNWQLEVKLRSYPTRPAESTPGLTFSCTSKPSVRYPLIFATFPDENLRSRLINRFRESVTKKNGHVF